jgi:hypothetical protein
MAKGQSVTAPVSVDTHEIGKDVLKSGDGFQKVSTAHIKWGPDLIGQVFTGTVLGINEFTFERNGVKQPPAMKYSMQLANGDVVGAIFGKMWDSFLLPQGLQVGSVLRFVYKGKVDTSQGNSRHDFEFAIKNEGV